MTIAKLFGNTPELKVLELIVPLAELGPLGFFENEPEQFPFTAEMVAKGTGLPEGKALKILKKFEDLHLIVEQKVPSENGWTGIGNYVFRPESNQLRAINNLILVEKAKEMKKESIRKMTPPQ